jgi:pimeloyl-ACP methyl ester carboxylesterase
MAVVKFALALFAATLCAQQPKRIPPPGITISAEDRAALEARLRAVREEFQSTADLAVRWKAVDWALRYNEFFKPEDVGKAHDLLDRNFGQPGLSVHGFRSDIDDSLQPYGLVTPPSYTPNARGQWRLDVWLHGRGETTLEVGFLHDRLTKPGEFTPRDTFVLHPFGRYCNAYKFAGETDVFEAIADVMRRYPIDPRRVAIRGFSMGGAGAWHLAAHHPGRWAAAAPGAGFVDTAEYQKLREKNLMPSDYEQTLWRLTNAKDYALNFFNLPVIAYSGEEDPQKAAADIMAREMGFHDLPLVHVIGLKTGHKYEPSAKAEIDRRFDLLMERGRETPRHIRFETYTLRYNRAHWLAIDRLKSHWERASVDARITPRGISAGTKNVLHLSFEFGPGEAPFPPGQPVEVAVDSFLYRAPPPASDRSWRFQTPGGRSGKLPGLQGPIDDAFFSRFIFVRPSASAPAWAKAEFERAVREWRSLFRGDAIVRDESSLTPDDLARANLVLWGSPQSSPLMAKWPAPVPWPDHPSHVLLAIYPNPDHAGRYVVLNSGPTFREASHATNAQQTAKLPDWAIVDTTVPPDDARPGRIVEAGFFDDDWKLPRRKLTLEPSGKR